MCEARLGGVSERLCNWPLISLDALYAQKSLMNKIVDQGADYLIALKKNNKKDHARVVEYFADTTFGKIPDSPAAFDAFEETHGP